MQVKEDIDGENEAARFDQYPANEGLDESENEDFDCNSSANK
jgi:hypothetical protein